MSFFAENIVFAFCFNDFSESALFVGKVYMIYFDVGWI